MDDTNDLVMDATEARDVRTCQTMSVDLPVLTYNSPIYVAIRFFGAPKNEKNAFFQEHTIPAVMSFPGD